MRLAFVVIYCLCGLTGIVLFLNSSMKQHKMEEQSRMEEQKVAIRLLEELGGSVGATNGEWVVGITLQRASPTTQISEERHKGNREIVNDDLKVVDMFPSLRELTVQSMEISDDGLRGLSPQLRLTSLAVFCPKVTQQGLGLIREMDGLESLKLPETQISDLSTLGFHHKPRLWYLDVSDTPLSSRALSELSHLKALRILDLSRTYIDDSGLQSLSALMELNELRLDDTKISDEGIVALRPLTKLKRLYVDNTNVTTRGRDALKRYLPNCQVMLDWGPGPGMMYVIPTE